MNRRAFFAGLSLAPVMVFGRPAKASSKSDGGQVVIRLQGDVYSQQSVEDLIRAINEAQTRGYRIKS